MCLPIRGKELLPELGEEFLCGELREAGLLGRGAHPFADQWVLEAGHDVYYLFIGSDVLDIEIVL